MPEESLPHDKTPEQLALLQLRKDLDDRLKADPSAAIHIIDHFRFYNEKYVMSEADDPREEYVRNVFDFYLYTLDPEIFL